VISGLALLHRLAGGSTGVIVIVVIGVIVALIVAVTAAVAAPPVAGRPARVVAPETIRLARTTAVTVTVIAIATTTAIVVILVIGLAAPIGKLFRHVLWTWLLIQCHASDRDRDGKDDRDRDDRDRRENGANGDDRKGMHTLFDMPANQAVLTKLSQLSIAPIAQRTTISTLPSDSPKL